MNCRQQYVRGFLLTVLVVASAASVFAHGQVPAAIDKLVHQFVDAFNAANYETMAAFYRESATSSFQERRNEQENRELHAQLLGMLGKLSIQEIEVIEHEEVRLVAAREQSGMAEIVFSLVGDPPRIDGFKVGMNDGHAPEDDHADATTEDAGPPPEGPFAFLGSAAGVYQTQVVAQADGSLLLVWVEKGNKGFDLFAARQEKGGAFSRRLQVNELPLSTYTGDEARPDVAVGPDGRVAVVWTSVSHAVHLAVGSDYGRQFAPPLRLNGTTGKVFRTMPVAAIGLDGVVHVVWLDPRQAPPGKEEPSDLYYARVESGVVQESNLTAKQEPTVCGCCRPFIQVDANGRLDIAFRNSSADGYRDISRIVGTPQALSDPQPTSPKIWKLGGCPMAGPVVDDGGTLWKDASTGSWRLLWSTSASDKPEVVLADEGDFVLTHSPRRVSGREDWVLLGANPRSLILGREGKSWKVLRDDLPAWATSAAVRDGQLFLVGNERGRLRASIEQL